ncbi:hypothetical protein ACFSUS_14135 [Spirosoma soli]|uniref:Uncharacterized protein n=1 Tax=Spirosoma soli TaxID=1770529 RepID=A0ABW5M622_9BACT
MLLSTLLRRTIFAVEPFYTYLNRERNEGLGNVNAVTGSVRYKAGRH